MKRRSKLAITAALALSGVVLGTYLSAPYVARRYIEKEYPGVTVQSVSLRMSGARMALEVKRPGIQASLPDVWVGRDKRVVVTGGHVWLTMGDTEASGGNKHKLTASGLTVEVTRKDWVGFLEGVDLAEDGTITVARGKGTGPDANGRFETARKNPDGTVSVLHAEVTVARDLPIKQPFTLEGVTVTADHQRVAVNAVIADGQRADGVTVEMATGGHLHVLAASVTVQHPWLNPVPVTFSALPVKLTVASGAPTGGMLTAEIGKAGISWHRASKTVDGVGSCEAWIAAFPEGLRNPLEDFRFEGEVNFRVIYGDTPSLMLKSSCKAKCDSPYLKALHKPFRYKVYTAKNDRVDRISGPGSVGWMPLGALNPTLPTAAITMEDPGFLFHKGFDVTAYRNSLVDNLKLGRFHRGGSTISMQLAKNLWLRRDKTFGRKAQEFFLAQALESCFTKDQILELYLNVVEYGPDLYGIGPAAEKYFKLSAGSLSPVQAFWLASILPKPRSAAPPDEATLDRTRKLMAYLVKGGRIPESYLEPPLAPGDDAEWGQ